jgi:hypothetical protein
MSDDGARQTYLVPRRWPLAISFDRSGGLRGIHRRNNARLSRFANNFALSDDPPERAEVSEPDAATPGSGIGLSGISDPLIEN